MATVETVSAADRVREETARFRAALPDLLQKYPGKWVVFRDGQVHSVHESADAAFRAGLEAFGREGSQVIAQVVELPPAPVTAGSLFNLVS